MTNNKQKNDKEKQVNFFQFTKEQLFINLEKYDCVKKGCPSTLFATPSLNQNKLKENSIIYPKRLNSIDTSMLEDVAYTVLDDEELKLEKKIENTEKILKELTEKLIVADTIKDEERKQELLSQRQVLMQKRNNLLEAYKSQSLFARLTSLYIVIVKFPQKIQDNFKKKLKKFIRNSSLLKRVPALVRAIFIRDTLNRLNKINRSVDELVSMKVPFGEQEAKYDALINHLSRATALQAKIRKELEK